MTLRGCDVSTFQSPTLVNWKDYDFGIVRASYGTVLDQRVLLHVERIRAAGKPVGLYHFFLPKVSIQAQFEAFCSVSERANLASGDIVPCIDIEAYPDQWKGKVPTHYADVAPSWDQPLRSFVGLIESQFGSCMPYITQRDWSMLGQPPWVLERPLWVANYPKRLATSPLARPATPGSRPYAIWQCMVGPLAKAMQLQDAKHPLSVDQNIAQYLPLIGQQLVLPKTRMTTIELQKKLNGILRSGGYNPLTEDGLLGPKTCGAARKFLPDEEVPCECESKGFAEPELRELGSAEPIDESQIPWIGLTEDDWEEMRVARDRHLVLTDS